MLLALREMPARRARPGLLPARKNRSLASRTSGALSGDILKTIRTERNTRLPNKKKKDGVRPVEHM
mgnify:CR=1 FL=1